MANWKLVRSPELKPILISFDNVSYFRAAFKPSNNANTVIAFSAQEGDYIVVVESAEELAELVSDDK